MRKTRKCAFCGKEFTCNSGSQRYCSEHCVEAAKAQRKKKQQDFLKAVQPVIDIASQEYLTFSKAAILMGCSRQYVYKLVNEGKLPASRISNRMAYIRKADIEKMLAGNPYHRVLPGASSSKKSSQPSSSSLSSRKANNHIPEKGMRSSEPLECDLLLSEQCGDTEVPVCNTKQPPQCRLAYIKSAEHHPLSQQGKAHSQVGGTESLALA